MRRASVLLLLLGASLVLANVLPSATPVADPATVSMRPASTVPQPDYAASISAAPELNYSLSIGIPVVGAGAGGWYPRPTQNIFDNVTYDPTENAFYSEVSRGVYHETLWDTNLTPFSPPAPGRYLFGVMGSTGGKVGGSPPWGAANWTVKQITVADAEGSHLVMSSAPNATYHPSLILGGLSDPGYDPQTGALELIPYPQLTVDGIALFPFDYAGGSLTIQFIANFTQDPNGPLDGLTTLFFISDALVSNSTATMLSDVAPQNESVPSDNVQLGYFAELSLPRSTTPYFAVQWELAWLWWDAHLGEMDVWTMLPEGTFVRALSASSTTLTKGGTLTLTTELSNSSAGLRFTYRGLPSGCSSSNATEVRCVPTSLGTFSIEVFANDSFGDSATAWVEVEVVAAPPASCGMSGCLSTEETVLLALAGVAVLVVLVADLVRRRRSPHDQRRPDEPITAGASGDTAASTSPGQARTSDGEGSDRKEGAAPRLSDGEEGPVDATAFPEDVRAGTEDPGASEAGLPDAAGPTV